MQYEQLFLWSLVVTISVETGALFFLVRKILKIREIPSKLLVFTGIICSLTTLPYLWFIFPMFIKSYLWLNIWGELSVFAMETIIIMFILRLGRKKAVLVSLVCNAASYGLGFILHMLI